ncbi:MAG: hypothetical protein ACRELG_24550 [Gemmataceae bacterium]
MGFGETVGEYLWFTFLAGWVLRFVAVKIIAAIDDDGAIKKTANEGLAAWTTRWMK